MQKMPIVKHRLDQMCRLFLYVNLKNERERILEKKKMWSRINDEFHLVRNLKVLVGLSPSRLSENCRVASHYTMNRGFSIGIGDVTPG